MTPSQPLSRVARHGRSLSKKLQIQDQIAHDLGLIDEAIDDIIDCCYLREYEYRCLDSDNGTDFQQNGYL